MKDEKSKYLIIDSINMSKEKQENGIKKVINAQEIFEKYNVPREYQKIIVKINNPLISKYEAEEYTMGFPFDLTAGAVRKEKDKKYLTASNPSNCNCTKKGYSKVTLETELKYSTFEDVMSLLVKMDESDCLKPYLQSIREFFDISLNLELLHQSWEESKYKPNKALKLYKKKIK